MFTFIYHLSAFPITEDCIADKWLSVDQENHNTLKMAIIRDIMFKDKNAVIETALEFDALLNI